MKQKVIRAGLTSLAVIIPARFVHALGIKKGDTALVTTHEDQGKVIMKFQGTLQLRLPQDQNARK